VPIESAANKKGRRNRAEGAAMRRKDREISNMEDIIAIIKKCDVCQLAIFDQEYPYIVPLNFGYSYDGTDMELYFHGANAGKKMELISRNNKAGFEMDCSHTLITGDEACDYTMEYESVCGNGIIELLEGEDKIKGLTFLMKQYSPEETFQFNEKHVNAVAVYKLKVNSITGKRLSRS
jgi:nitroimidazol reductase NimA-like FMN-containing flavoprotein (pyridoxamine 5'-phosphate oxidase superfamily)